MKPCIQFLELFAKNPTKIFEEYIIREENRKKNMKPLNYFFDKTNKTDMTLLDASTDLSNAIKLSKPKKKN